MYFNIEEKFDVAFENDVAVLVGWAGIGLIGKLAIESIKNSLNADLYLEIEYFDFPAKSRVDNGQLELPTAEVFYKSRKEENKPDILALISHTQPKNPEGVYDFSRQFCEKIDELTDGQIKIYISAGALISDKKTEDRSKVNISSTDKVKLDEFLEFENTMKMESGAIAGANGIMPTWAGRKGYAPGICLLAETIPMPMMNVDPEASKSLVEVLSAYLEIDMDYTELDKKVEDAEDALDNFKKQADAFMKGSKKSSKELDSYFR
ncbi:MAG: PAC2 family protein [Promethearchaeia archaeon]